MYKFNVNSEVSIEVKPNTLDIIKEKVPGSDKSRLNYIEYCIKPYIYKRDDGKSFLKMSLWEVMYFFGDKLGLEVEMPFGTEILLKETDCEKY